MRATFAGIRRKLGVRPNRKRALRAHEVLAAVALLDRATIKGKRDAAVLLVEPT